VDITASNAGEQLAGSKAALSASEFRCFMLRVCPACKGPKLPFNAFCRTCYRKLPGEMKSALWQQFGEGFELAYCRAQAWLVGQ
jgi:hypothetical protein